MPHLAPENFREFKSYGKSPSELCDYALSYCDNKTLFNYAQCSKMCHEEIQKYNIIAPSEINLKYDEKENSTKVRMVYKNSYKYKVVYCESGAPSKYTLGEAAKVIEKSLKYVKPGEYIEICLELDQWPTDVMNLRRIREASALTVRLSHDHIYHEFSNFLNESQITKLIVSPTEYSIPNSFFNSVGFQRIEFANFKLNTEIDEQQFLSSKARVLHVGGSAIRDVTFNEKIRRWYRDTSPLNISYRITKRNDNLHTDVDALKRGFPFFEQDFPKMCSSVQRADGKVADLFILLPQMMFQTGWVHDNDRFF